MRISTDDPASLSQDQKKMLEALAALETVFNGGERKTCFAVIAFPYQEPPVTVRIVSNGGNHAQLVDLLEKALKQLKSVPMNMPVMGNA